VDTFFPFISWSFVCKLPTKFASFSCITRESQTGFSMAEFFFENEVIYAFQTGVQGGFHNYVWFPFDKRLTESLLKFHRWRY
jgi:hypothetical protein